MRVLVIHGPNLNLLGERQPDIYGSQTLSDVNAAIMEAARTLNVDVRIVQHNSEGAIIEAIHEARLSSDGIVLNAGAYTHYSYAIADAIAAVTVPVVEVHMTNVHARELFRRTSVIAPACAGSVAGFGIHSYVLALNALVARESCGGRKGP